MSWEPVGRTWFVQWIRQYTACFGRKIAALLPDLKPRTSYVSHSLDTDVFTMWNEWPWGDSWADADMRRLVKYLYGSKHVVIPPEWKAVLPSSF